MQTRERTLLQGLQTLTHDGLKSNSLKYTNTDPKCVNIDFYQCVGYEGTDKAIEFNKKAKLIADFIDQEHRNYDNLKYKFRLFRSLNTNDPQSVQTWNEITKNTLAYLKEKGCEVVDIEELYKTEKGIANLAQSQQMLDNYFDEKSSLHDFSHRKKNYEEKKRLDAERFAEKHSRPNLSQDEHLEISKTHVHNENLFFMHESMTPKKSKEVSKRNNKDNPITVMIANHTMPQSAKEIVDNCEAIGLEKSLIYFNAAKIKVAGLSEVRKVSPTIVIPGKEEEAKREQAQSLNATNTNNPGLNSSSYYENENQIQSGSYSSGSESSPENTPSVAPHIPKNSTLQRQSSVTTFKKSLRSSEKSSIKEELTEEMTHENKKKNEHSPTMFKLEIDKDKLNNHSTTTNSTTLTPKVSDQLSLTTTNELIKSTLTSEKTTMLRQSHGPNPTEAPNPQTTTTLNVAKDATHLTERQQRQKLVQKSRSTSEIKEGEKHHQVQRAAQKPYTPASTDASVFVLLAGSIAEGTSKGVTEALLKSGTSLNDIINTNIQIADKLVQTMSNQIKQHQQQQFGVLIYSVQQSPAVLFQPGISPDKRNNMTKSLPQTIAPQARKT